MAVGPGAQGRPMSLIALPAAREPDGAVHAFLVDLEHSNRSPHTRRAYASDLASFNRYYTGPLGGITPEVLRGYFSTLAGLSPSTRARKQAALASFLGWAFEQDLIDSNPMGKVSRVKIEPPQPRGIAPKLVEKVLAAIPSKKKRDRLLFRLIYETGMRAGEALQLYVEDLDLSRDDERIRVAGKGGKGRTILLDNPALVKQLQAYLKETGYKQGALFRAEKNHRGGALRYHSARELWEGYCNKEGVECTLHQLRHTHATELVNDDVPLETIRRRLGHRNMQTTLRYAEQLDKTSDTQMREWRRRRG
ncbi:MAG: tyrosine-type recombinase/integrase [Chloroflexota bacterium]|nr:tyrosine-type recombinase/integrase [Chloroflexota bacterium]